MRDLKDETQLLEEAKQFQNPVDVVGCWINQENLEKYSCRKKCRCKLQIGVQGAREVG